MLALVDGVAVCVPLVLVISGSPSVCEAVSVDLRLAFSQQYHVPTYTATSEEHFSASLAKPDITSNQSVWDFLSDETYGENTTFGGGDEDLISLLDTRDMNLYVVLTMRRAAAIMSRLCLSSRRRCCWFYMKHDAQYSSGSCAHIIDDSRC